MFYTYEYTQYIFSMKYSAHYIIYTALSTLYLRALHPDCMFGIKQLNINKDMDVPLVFLITLIFFKKKSVEKMKNLNTQMDGRKRLY